MTRNEADVLSEQLKELELLEQEKKNRKDTKNSQQQTILNRSEELSSKLTEFGSFISNPVKSESENLVDLDMGISTNQNVQMFTDILNNASNEFEKEWNSAFTTTSSNQINNSTVQHNQASDFLFFNQLTANQDLASLNSHSNEENLLGESQSNSNPKAPGDTSKKVLIFLFIKRTGWPKFVKVI